MLKSRETHIPQAVLVREGVDMIIEELSNKAESLNFLTLVKKKVKKDGELLKKLSK